MSNAPYWFGGVSTPAVWNISNSLRFRNLSGPTYLHRQVPSVATTPPECTLSFWVKLGGTPEGSALTAIMSVGDATNNHLIYHAGTNPGNTYAPENSLSYAQIDGTVRHKASSFGFKRDFSAWQHYVIKHDYGTSPTDTHTVEVYINGVAQGTESSTTADRLFGGWVGRTSGTSDFYIGENQGGTTAFGGYIAEIHCTESLQDATDFGEFDTNNIWVPKEYTGGNYGTNGFYLDLSDPTDIGADRSGNGNDFTATAFELVNSSDSQYDHMLDTPIVNYPVFNRIEPTIDNGDYSGVLSEGNLTLTTTGSAVDYYPTLCSMGVREGKWYWEVTANNSSDTGGCAGVATSTIERDVPLGFDANGWGLWQDGTIHNDSSNTGTAYGSSWTDGDIIGVYLDADNGKLWFYKNGVEMSGSGDPAAGTGAAFTNLPTDGTVLFPAGGDADFTVGVDMSINFGQRGGFEYTPVAGYNAINSTNIGALQTSITPTDHFDMISEVTTPSSDVLQTAQTIFSDGLYLIKSGSASSNWQWFATERGTSVSMQSPIGLSNTSFIPTGAGRGWLWSVPGAPVSNTDGSITSQVQANTTAGFSIVSYSGTGSNATVGHGLNEAPEFMIVMNTTTTNGGDFAAYSKYANTDPSLSGDRYLDINSTTSTITNSTVWNDQNPSNTVFNVGTSIYSNDSAHDYYAFCWHSVPGYSDFGTYVGNGETADGTFVYTGFTPKFVMFKTLDMSASWMVHDTQENPDNVIKDYIRWDDNFGYNSSSVIRLDIVSNGFKPYTSHNYGGNGNQSRYLYMAFAEDPLGTRAR